MERPARVAGVDFSGARDARENVWIAECERAADGLRLRSLAPASERLDPTGADPAATAHAVSRFVRDHPGAVGVDAPFSLPAPVVRELGHETWREVVRWVAAHDDASAFDAACQAATPGDRTYARRAVDDRLDSFSPYHFFVKRQTYHAVGGVLAPLVADDAARVLPFALDDEGDGPFVLETYPAAVFERLGAHREEYKGPGEDAGARRERNLAALRGVVAVPDDLAARAVADADGDALDAVAAAVGTARAFETGLVPATDDWRVEGAIYPLPGGEPHDTWPSDGDGGT